MKSPSYLFDLIPPNERVYNLRNSDNIPDPLFFHNFYQNSFFPSDIHEWNKLNLDTRNSESFSVFKNKILKFIRPSSKSIFGIHDPIGVKLLTRLRLGLSHLKEP